MQQERSKDWIDYISDQVYRNYNGREIVIWGRYGVSDEIKKTLAEKYGIDIAFCVDSDKAKIDNKQVFSPNYIAGKSDKYYMVVPLAFYKGIKEQLILGGYKSEVDYCYFCDCILVQKSNYYEDVHGNKIIGDYQGLKFAFTGFNSVIELGENVRFQDTVFYIHNDSMIVISNNTRFEKTYFYIHNDSKIKIDNDVQFKEIHLRCYHSAEVILNEKVKVGGQGTDWEIGENAKLQIGNEAYINGGVCSLGENASFIIGKRFSLNENYRIVICDNTSIYVGDDCMFSYDIRLRSNDGHSIFDIATGRNINCSYKISKNRKIVIGSHVWIGEGTEVLYNTQIGDGSIIGTMSLVKGKIPNNCIAAGIPARVIRKNIAWSRQYGIENIIDCGREYIHYTEEV